MQRGADTALRDLNTLEAYELLEKKELQDLNSVGYRLRHKKTGAKIALIRNDDENKVFYIGFRTPPKDSTGVAHIVEHTVLCGSDKFPVKDPFVELAKGSLNTFLNAMTYPDKTVYPVASCNDKDFANLMDVYMDAVFHTNIYKKEEIFRQEGWNYHLENPEDVHELCAKCRHAAQMWEKPSQTLWEATGGPAKWARKKVALAERDEKIRQRLKAENK